MGRKKKGRRDGAPMLRRVVSFDEKSRWEFLTGFHKRKVERRKVALEEIKRKLKEEEKKMKEERHKEYMKMLKEREEALEEADELEHLVTSQTESVSYDHPNHTVTVTTISDLDLSGARVLGLTENENTDPEGEDTLNTSTLPKKSRDPLLSERISSLTASLHSRTQKKGKRKKINHKQGTKNRGQIIRTGRTSKSQRRKMTGGRRRHVQD
ncbi:nucleolar protein 12 isoform X1 [Pantherophis guttatus]|uniref:Nucleolar protein 12 n=1 Tax=Pantherophis guttatus TaxID=94885 RepID=A0A6P9ASZ1_PANGU|nr:nucleolar protein 12 isoform X1 [Pantherophis guttatus]